MNIKLRYPDFTIPSPVDPIRRVQNYLHQVVDELNIALQDVETQVAEAKTAAVKASTSAVAADEKAAQSTFNSIKSLIIKSADIVNAYSEAISKRLEGVYVSESDFGTYKEETANEIKANSTAIEQYYTSMQEILSDIETLENSLIEVNAHIRSGLLYYDESGVPVYGLEVGQMNEIDGERVFNKYARFTADKLSFYDSNDNEVAYISDQKLYITHVEVTGSYKIGGFVDTVMPNKSVVTRWVEDGGEE